AFVAFMIISLRYLSQLRRQTQDFAHHFVTAILIIFSVNYLIDIIDAHFVDAGEWQLLMSFLALATGIGMQVQQQENAVAPASDAQQANTQEETTLKRRTAISLPAAIQRAQYVRAAAVLGVGVILLSSALAWYHGRHTPAPPQPLAVSVFDTGAPVTIENFQNIGTTAWQLDKQVDTTYLQGYAGNVSIQAGDTLPLYISARAPITYNLDVYRIGWYMGLGGRLYASAHNLFANAQGYWSPQDGLSNCATCTTDPTTHLIEARWAQSYDLATGSGWLSGVYLIKLTATGGSTRAESYIPFIIRNDASQSAVLVNLPVNTYEANNIWGGYSLNQHGTQTNYTGAISPDRATQVSFDRPFASSAGAGDFLNWDIHGVRFLERAGLDVSYTTNVDVATHPEQLQQHRVFVTLGHDAYWTNSIYQGLTSARDQGVSLIFLGGGDGHWQARLEPDSAGAPDRTLVSYQVSSTATDPTMRLSADPEYQTDRALVTAAWSDPVLNRP
ncbi:MAG TPA: N,N-dimethylformamidase beta subunit family domain-containing protein, partial [Ktedonobacterales bacterium]|nr:N,N-dimethylformamidase beta subunit family domain-containing protein [Ktedonobacterales bacterium]